MAACRRGRRAGAARPWFGGGLALSRFFEESFAVVPSAIIRDVDRLQAVTAASVTMTQTGPKICATEERWPGQESQAGFSDGWLVLEDLDSGGIMAAARTHRGEDGRVACCGLLHHVFRGRSGDGVFPEQPH
jgi:hypothetical protein